MHSIYQFFKKIYSSNNKLIIGCGARDTNSFEMQKYQQSHAQIHPYSNFDTMDIDTSINPTYSLNINNFASISAEFPPGKYNLIVFERFPANLLEKGAALSASYLSSKNGMIILLPTGDRIKLFKNLLINMEEGGFNTFIASTHLICFFKTHSTEQALATLREMANNLTYVKQLFTSDGFLMRSFAKENILTLKDIDHHVWDIQAFLLKYTESKHLNRDYLNASELNQLLSHHHGNLTEMRFVQPT